MFYAKNREIDTQYENWDQKSRKKTEIKREKKSRDMRDDVTKTNDNNSKTTTNKMLAGIDSGQQNQNNYETNFATFLKILRKNLNLLGKIP